MKLSLILTFMLVSLVAYNEVNAQFFPGFGLGRFRFGGLGFRRFGFGGFGGFGRFGFGRRFGFGFGRRFGFGPFGIGGFGFRRILPIPVPVPVPAPVPAPIPGPIGKRSVTETEIPLKEENEDDEEEEELIRNIRDEEDEEEEEERRRRDVMDMTDMTNRTMCTFSSNEEMLTCRGKMYNFECEATPNFEELPKFNFNLKDLTVIEDVLPIREPTINPITYKLFSHDIKKPKLLNEFTVMSKEKMPYLFSIYESDKIIENGLRIVDPDCWDKFDTMMNELKPTDVKMSLIISH